ncbi:MAG TPA: XRE family transcriptional regulator [Chloroflexia bacterium]|nr:XRE family transcriptional regulator [Chloroflexia bacterium]
MLQMNRGTKSVNPDLIIVARQTRGLTQKDLAQALRVTQGRISKMEAGLLPVPDDLLERLARVLEYPPHFFQQDEPVMSMGIAEIFHRKRQDVPQRVLEKIHATMDKRRREIAALLRSAEIQYDVPRLDPDEYGGRADKIAQLVRAHWQLKPGLIRDLTRTMEDSGIVIIPMDFETTRVDAISRWVPRLPPLIFVNEKVPKDRLRFSLAHELGHLVMHTLAHPDAERQADEFASEFLLPSQDIQADLRDLSLTKLAILKRHWKVSMAAILKRADDLGVITPNQARYLWAQMARSGWKRREPLELDVAGEEPKLVCELVEAHVHDLGYSDTDFSYLVALNPNESWEYYLRHANPSTQINKPHQILRAL